LRRRRRKTTRVFRQDGVRFQGFSMRLYVLVQIRSKKEEDLHVEMMIIEKGLCGIFHVLSVFI
jgi:hypothetical protein